MYENLRPLDKSTDLPRLPAPETALPPVNPIAISIAPIEAALMAERYPLAWRREGEDWDLVALTGLVPAQKTFEPAQAASGSRVVPLLLRAYPLAVFDDGREETLRILVDTPALLTPWHPAVRDYRPEEAEAALDQRLQALWTYASSRRLLQPAFREIAEAGAMRPWELGFRNQRHSIALDGFYHVDWSYLGSPSHQSLVARHGFACASLLALHRMSLHRVGALLRDLAEAEAA